MTVGEIANFAAYTFAPPILVTPLGALSVLIGSVSCSDSTRNAEIDISSSSAVLASFFLNEQLGRIGRAGCSLCLVGSIIIVLHAPEDKELQTVDEMLQYALQPGQYSVLHSTLRLLNGMRMQDSCFTVSSSSASVCG